MNSFLEWKFASRNLLRNQRRTFSTGLAMVVAFVAISLLAGHIFHSRYSIKALVIYLNHLGHISIYKKGGVENFELHPDQFQISDAELAQLTEVLKPLETKISATGSFLSTPALLSNGTKTIPIVLQGMTPELDEFTRHHPLVLKWIPELQDQFSKESFLEIQKQIPDAISISQGVGELLGQTKPLEKMSSTEKEIQIAGRTIDGDLNAVNGTLAMRHTTGMPYLEDISVNTSLALVQELMQTKGVARTVLYLKNESDIPATVKLLKQDFQKRGLTLEALSYRDDRIGEFYNGSISFMYTMAAFFGALILGASALIIVNSLTMSLLERTREIGTLRAIGYTSGRLKSLFIKEAVVLAIISSVAGIVVTEILAKLINLGGFKLEVPGVSYQINFEVIIEFWFYAAAAAGMIAMTTICSYWVIRRKMEEKIYHLLLESGAVS